MRPVLLLSCVGLAGVPAAGCADGPDDDTYDCVAEKRDEEFFAGIAKPGDASRLEFKLVSADPALPSRGDNTWMLQLSTMAQPIQPVTGASVTVSPFMPDHGHPSGKAVTVTPDGATPGLYKLEPVNMSMPGVWETTMQVNGGPSAATGDRVVFKFCLST